MNPTRLALQLVGAVFILLALAVAYYQTPIHDSVPEGAFLGLLVALVGLLVIGFASEFPRTTYARDVEHVERVDRRTYRPSYTTYRPARPRRVVRRETVEDVDGDALDEPDVDVEHYEHVERRA